MEGGSDVTEDQKQQGGEKDTSVDSSISAGRIGRRALTLGIAAGGVGLAASVIGGKSADAATGDALVLGEQSNAESSTVLYADSGSFGHGLLCVTDTPFSDFVPGFPHAAVTGYAGSTDSGPVGVAGYGTSFGTIGAVGDIGMDINTPSPVGAIGLDNTDIDGTALAGVSASGTGVIARSGTGTALWADGPATFSGVTQFSRSGLATVTASASSVTVPHVALSGTSLVLANLQVNLKGVYVQSVVPNPNASKFTIHLSMAVPEGKTAKVAWFVVN